MSHPSPEDPRVHSTITGEDNDGKEIFRKHVPYDPSTDAVRKKKDNHNTIVPALLGIEPNII